LVNLRGLHDCPQRKENQNHNQNQHQTINKSKFQNQN